MPSRQDLLYRKQKQKRCRKKPKNRVEDNPLADEAVNSFENIVNNFSDGKEIPSHITIDELIESQAQDKFCKNIRLAINDVERVRFQDNSYTRVL